MGLRVVVELYGFADSKNPIVGPKRGLQVVAHKRLWAVGGQREISCPYLSVLVTKLVSFAICQATLE